MTRQTGQLFEKRAQKALKQQGLIFIKANFSTRFGEIDLIMRDGTLLVFVEVRYRQSTQYGSAAATVTPGKQQRLIRCASHFLATHPDYAEMPCRFDVVTYEGTPKNAVFTWQKAAFDIF